jgi:hypothetical protein
VIDSATNTVVDAVNVGSGPTSLQYNPSNGHIYSPNQNSNDVSVIDATEHPSQKPIADAGPDQTVESNDLVHLDGSNSSNSSGSPLTYSWNQTSGPEVTLSDPTSSNPTFTAPEVNEQTELTFQLTVTNDEGITSEPDEMTITVNPITIPPPEEEEPRTISDILKGVIHNLLDVTNSIESANEIQDILTDNNRNNDLIVCDLIDSETEYTSNIREILNC